MSDPTLRIRCLLLLALALGGCGDERAPGAGAPPEDEETDAPALALYRRELLYVPDDPDGSAAALRAQVRPASDRMLRGTHAWLSRGGEWTPLLQDQWEAAPLRQPWRILPHGTLRILVEDGGELESLIFGRSADAPRLNPGPLAAEWTSGPDVRVLVREGELFTGGSAGTGLVLDVELGAQRLPEGRMGALLFLVDTAGAPLAAVRLPEGELRLLTFTGGGVEDAVPARIESGGGGWRLTDEAGEPLGQLEPVGEAPASGAEEDPNALPSRPPVRVSGWMGGTQGRRPVRGLLFAGER